MLRKRHDPRRAIRRHSESEARRLGWHRLSPITWREFLEQYPYGAREIAAARDLHSAA
jgi:hypothetical protein